MTDDGFDTFLFHVEGDAEAYAKALDTTAEWTVLPERRQSTSKRPNRNS